MPSKKQQHKKYQSYNFIKKKNKRYKAHFIFYPAETKNKKAYFSQSLLKPLNSFTPARLKNRNQSRDWYLDLKPLADQMH